MTNLPVPYKSQWDADAKGTQNDCGPASIAMALNYYGESLTTDQVYQKTGAGAGLIGIAEMNRAIAAFGYSVERKTQSTPAELKACLDQNLPVIALVHYGSLGPTVQDKTFKGGHFFLVVGYRDDGYFVNDPNFWDAHRQDGDHHFYPKAAFEKAWSDASLDGNQKNSFQVINRKSVASSGCLVPNTPENRQKQDTIVHNSTLADDVVRYLNLGDKADNVSFDNVKNSLEAREGKLTSCKTELSTRDSELAAAKTEVSNREEQVGRLKEDLRKQDELYKAEITAIKSSQTNPEQITEKLRSELEQLRSDFREEAEAKGKALIALAETQSRLETAQKGQFGDLTFSLWIKLFLSIKWI